MYQSLVAFIDSFEVPMKSKSKKKINLFYIFLYSIFRIYLFYIFAFLYWHIICSLGWFVECPLPPKKKCLYFVQIRQMLIDFIYWRFHFGSKRTKIKTLYMFGENHMIRSKCVIHLEFWWIYCYYLCKAVFLQTDL